MVFVCKGNKNVPSCPFLQNIIIPHPKLQYKRNVGRSDTSGSLILWKKREGQKHHQGLEELLFCEHLPQKVSRMAEQVFVGARKTIFLYHVWDQVMDPLYPNTPNFGAFFFSFIFVFNFFQNTHFPRSQRRIQLLVWRGQETLTSSLASWEVIQGHTRILQDSRNDIRQFLKITTRILDTTFKVYQSALYQ